MSTGTISPCYTTITWFDWLKFSSPFIIGFIAFIWYRRGRLWKFYYNLLDASIKQMVDGCIIWEGWNEIASTHTTALATDYFGSLFQFELEYLRLKIDESKWIFWGADGSTKTYPQIDKHLNAVRVEEVEKVTNKAHFANTLMRESFFKEVRFAGAGLLFKSLWHLLFFKVPTGVVRSQSKTPIKGILGPHSESPNSPDF